MSQLREVLKKVWNFSIAVAMKGAVSLGPVRRPELPRHLGRALAGGDRPEGGGLETQAAAAQTAG